MASQWREKFSIIRAQYESVHYQEAVVLKSLVSYFDVKVESEDVSSKSSIANGCSRWNQFLSLLSTVQIGYQATYVSVMSINKLTTELKDAANITCEVASVAASISDALVSQYRSSSSALAVSCLSTEDDGKTSAVTTRWRVKRCGSSPFLEVSIDSTVFLRLSPCNSTCDKSVGSVGLLRNVAVQYKARYQAPTILSLSVTSVSTSTVSVMATLDDFGLIYCAAYVSAAYADPTSVEAVMISSMSAWSSSVSGKNVSHLNITSLAASTEYTVLCVASSVQSIASSLQTVLAKYNRTVTTACCRVLSVSVLSSVIQLSPSSSRGTGVRQNALRISLSQLPIITAQSVSVTVYLRKDNISYHSAFSPGVLTFDTSSTVALYSLTLLSLSSAGTYSVTVSLTGTGSHLYDVAFAGSGGSTIAVIDTSLAGAVVAPPTMLSATFSPDGTNISVVFDRSVSLAQDLGISTQFVCSKLFRLGDTGAASTASCQFGSNGTVVTVKPSSSSTLVVGSDVTLLAATIKAACFVNYNCSKWRYATAATVSIVAPSVLTIPTVTVLAPNSIGSCTNLVLDVSGSVGAGYQTWKSISYQVLSSALNASDLQAHLANLAATGPVSPVWRISVPYVYLNAQSLYSISVTLCNFLDACGQAHISLSVSGLSAPVVSIVGSKTISLQASQAMTLKAAAYTASCTSTSSSSAKLAYSWSIVPRSTSVVQVSASSGSPLLTLGAYSLIPLNAYDVTVTVTSISNKQASTATVTVSVLQGSLVSVITGGLSRSVRVLTWTSVDGSGSYDMDQAAKGNVGLSYIWSAYQLTPVFQSHCNSLSMGTSSSGCQMYGLVNATNSTCVASLVVSMGARTASSSVSVYFMSDHGPKVTISSTTPSSLTHIAVSAKVSVLATITSESLPIICVWSFDDSVSAVSGSLSLSAVALTSTKVIVPASASLSVTPLNLVIGASQLPSSSQLTLSLTCSYINISSAALTSVNTIQISTNAPPSPGVFTVSPTSGASLTTVFTYGASAWSDADSDYPLKYEYGFVSPTDGTFVVVSSRSLTVYATTTLPPGQKASSYAVSTQLNVYDALSAITTSTVVVRVNNSLFASTSSSSSTQKLNMTHLASLVSSGLTTAGLDTDSLKQVIVTAAVAMNSVSCALAPANCSALGRYDCSSVIDTCGACLPSHVGIAGSSNEPCVSVRVASSFAVDIVCTDDADCPSAWYLCNSAALPHVCYSPAKTCVNNCTAADQGTCVFEDVASGSTRDTCTRADMSCVAVCACLNGYSGSSCDVSPAELSSRQTVRSQLIDSFEAVLYTESSSDASTVSAWAKSLQSLTAAPAELNISTQDKTLELISFVVNANTEQGLGFSTVSAAIFQSIDNLCRSADATASLSARRRLTSSATTDNETQRESLKGLLDDMANTGLADLVAGEDASKVVSSNYRMNLQVFSSQSTGHHTVTTPLSGSETANNVTAAATMSLPLTRVVSTSLNSSLSYSVAMTSLKSSLFSSYDPSVQSLAMNGKVALANYLANPLRISVQADSQLCSNSTAASSYAIIKFKFKNTVTDALKQITSANISHTTDCIVEAQASGGYRISVHNYSCPSGSNITHVCDGTRAYTLTSTCPNIRTSPQCVASLSSDATSTVDCTISEYTVDYTVCSCSMCALSTDSSTARSRQRRGLSSLDASNLGSYGAEVQGLASYVSADFVTATKHYSTLNGKSIAKADIVVISFVLLWSLMFLCVGGIEVSGVLDRLGLDTGYAGKRGYKQIADISKALAPSTTTTSLEEAKTFMKTYVFTFLPNVFSEKDNMVKFWHEILYRHRYFSIIVRETGFKKFAGLVEILTLLTAHMFLIAVFFDAEWPSDTGYCSSLTVFGQVTCLRRRSMFENARSLCEWIPTSSDGGTCAWVEPAFDPFTQIVITMLVLLFSGPINILISALVKIIILSPTQSEITKQKEIIRVRRASAVGALRQGRGTVASPEAVSNVNVCLDPRGSQSRVVPVDATGFGNADSLSRPKRSSFLLSAHIARVADLDESLLSYCVDDHVIHKQLDSTLSNALVGPPSECRPENDNDDNNLAMFSGVMKLLSLLRTQQSLVTEKDKEQFEDQWGDMLVAASSARKKQSKDDHILHLTEELSHVSTEAEAIITKLRNLNTISKGSTEVAVNDGRKRNSSAPDGNTDAMIGVRILELFVLDLMGRHSNQARLFANQRSAVQIKFATSMWVKGLALAVLLGLDVYFVLMCVLYGDLKGKTWQLNWMISSFVYVMVDVFIKHVNIVFLVYYCIPELIKMHTDAMKLRLTKAIDAFVVDSVRARERTKSNQHPSMPKTEELFSVTDYLFVSTIVARAFPHLLESRIVLSYRSLVVSEYQAAKLKAKSTYDQNASYWSRLCLPLVEAVQTVGSKDPDSSRWRLNTCTSVVSITFVNLLIALGCQDVVIQKLVVQTLDPLIMGAIAALGSTIIHSSMLGVPVIIAIIIVVVGVYVHYSYRRRRVHAQTSKLNQTVPHVGPVEVEAQAVQFENCNSVNPAINATESIEFIASIRQNSVNNSSSESNDFSIESQEIVFDEDSTEDEHVTLPASHGSKHASTSEWQVSMQTQDPKLDDFDKYSEVGDCKYHSDDSDVDLYAEEFDSSSDGSENAAEASGISRSNDGDSSININGPYNNPTIQPSFSVPEIEFDAFDEKDDD
jgi:hypothetical protein